MLGCKREKYPPGPCPHETDRDSDIMHFGSISSYQSVVCGPETFMSFNFVKPSSRNDGHSPLTGNWWAQRCAGTCPNGVWKAEPGHKLRSAKLFMQTSSLLRSLWKMQGSLEDTSPASQISLRANLPGHGGALGSPDLPSHETGDPEPRAGPLSSQLNAFSAKLKSFLFFN